VIGLANEVASKKISSEEETYSDQSILIYYNNFEGIQQAVMPFMAALEAANATTASNLEKAFMAADASVAPYVTGGAITSYLTQNSGAQALCPGV
jgi:iron uptake system component EfeO